MQKTVVITGTTSGIGEAIATEFEFNDWQVIHVNRKDVDLSNHRHVMRYKPPGPIDALVNNAGIMPLVDFEVTTIDQWEKIINTNLRAPFFLCQRLIPYLKDGGHILNIASTAGIHPDKEFMAYSISKAGLISLTTALAKRYGERLYVNAIAPGFVETNLCHEPTPPELIDDIPKGRQAQPEEVARLAYHVINDRYFNGSVIRYDGGMLAKYEGGL